MPFDTSHIWTTLHFAALTGLAAYGCHRLWILALWRREKAVAHDEPAPSAPCSAPLVTVQLPVYNERFVAARLIDAAARLRWPSARLEIQVLDDSTDDTVSIVDERTAYWLQRGTSVHVLRRSHRRGYKAGALDYGLTQASGEFLAVFDADFIPPADFLECSVPWFGDRRVGMVQARWGFLNEGRSWFTRIQALLLGAHFRIEHWTRFQRRLFFNFNGTAGIWRRAAIELSGGWQADTVTEDLDLSYRAQLAGWRFVYLDDLVVPSELPFSLSAFRCQQQRWAKGSLQTARKILPRIFISSLPWRIKFEASAHLLANLGWLSGALVTLTLYPTLLQRIDIGPHELLRLDAPLLLCTSVVIVFFFFVYAAAYGIRRSAASLLLLPVLSIGMAPSLAISVLRGAIQRGGVFERTPKFGLTGRNRLPRLAFLYRQKIFPYLLLNSALLVYSLLPVAFVIKRETWPALPFVLLFPAGFLLSLLADFAELREHYLQQSPHRGAAERGPAS